MAKIMLVEDDNSLREIYGERLKAEGYTIISAGDGEEALAQAVREKPDLIISDVMMPKISGFDMLDILRSTPEIKNTPVILMTALGQAEEKQRADKLGADRYLVKSQVTLEDMTRVVHEMLDGGSASGPTAPADPAANTAQPSVTAPQPTPAAAEPAVQPMAVASPPPAAAQPISVPVTTPADPVAQPSEPVQPQPATPAAPTPATPQAPSDAPVAGVKVIQPLTDGETKKPDIYELLQQELAKEQTPPSQTPPPATPQPPASPASNDPNAIAL